MINMSSKRNTAASEEETIEITGPLVKMPSNDRKWRKGKGYSYKEIRAADVPVGDLIKAGIPIDKRRRSLHSRNVEELGTLYRQMVATDTLSLSPDEGQIIHEKQAMRHLRKLSEINKQDAQTLVKGGIYTIANLAEEEPTALAKDLDLDPDEVKKWVESAKSVKKIMDAKSAFKKLSKIRGIKKKHIKPLLEIGVKSIDDLLDSNPEKVAEALKLDLDDILYWFEQAAEITGSEEGYTEVTPVRIGKKKGYKEEVSEELEEETEEAEKEIEEEITTDEGEEDIGIEDLKAKAKKELKKCKGIGKVTATTLIEAGIYSIEDLINADLDELEAECGISKSQLKKFKKSAKKVE
ncbi:MAG: hypothetical protein GF329_04465 [Candidatus Lokiarchaeota archaeon]|nr:hypothetical protein [Candidatus Lokiarchaeota archaeon]